MGASYEAAAEREMIKQARRCAQLEMALEAVRAKLDVYLPVVPDCRAKEELRDLVGRIDLALGRTT